MTSLIGGKMPPLQSMRFGLKMYGLSSGAGHRGKAMAWLMGDQTLVVVQNDQSQPDGVRRTVHPVTDVRVSSMGLTASIPGDPGDGSEPQEFSLVQAPCVCGAGPTATAMPEPVQPGHRLDLQPLEIMPPWIRSV